MDDLSLLKQAATDQDLEWTQSDGQEDPVWLWQSNGDAGGEVEEQTPEDAVEAGSAPVAASG
jgi:hypothetical protein